MNGVICERDGHICTGWVTSGQRCSSMNRIVTCERRVYELCTNWSDVNR